MKSAGETRRQLCDNSRIVNDIGILDEIFEEVRLRLHPSSWIRHPEDWEEEKTPPDFVIWIVREGKVEVRAGEKVWKIFPGDLCVLPPGLTYQAKNLAKFSSFYFIHFDLSLVQDKRFFIDLSLEGPIRGREIRSELKSCVADFEAFRQKKSLAGLRFKGALQILIGKLLLIRQKEKFGWKRGQKVALQPLPSRGVREFWKIKPALDTIHSLEGRPVPNRDLALACGMNVNYFCGCFKKAVGYTPAKYAEFVRMNRAGETLLLRRHSVREVAHQLGFADAATFSKAFKRHFGVPPSGYGAGIK